jgi:hypothetical protein
MRRVFLQARAAFSGRQPYVPKSLCSSSLGLGSFASSHPRRQWQSLPLLQLYVGLSVSQSPSIAVLALIQPLHGITFALLHLACMRIIVRVAPASLAATAQATYAFGITATSAVVTLLSGYLYGAMGVSGFVFMGLLSLTALPIIWLLSRSLRDREAR